MSSANKISIKLSSIFFENIISRASISMLFSNDMRNIKIDIDFAEIKFLSRSSAQQLQIEIATLKSRNAEVELINTDESIDNMLRLVQAKPQRLDKSNIPVLSFSSENERRDFLLSF